MDDAGMDDAGMADAGMADAGMTCGNNMIEGTETCDDGNTDVEACPYGTATCMVCGDACTMVSSTGPVCGDSMVEAGEETCDDGASNGTYGSCNAMCAGVLECGDGIVNGPEECEPPGTATCDASCVTIP